MIFYVVYIASIIVLILHFTGFGPAQYGLGRTCGRRCTFCSQYSRLPRLNLIPSPFRW